MAIITNYKILFMKKILFILFSFLCLSNVVQAQKVTDLSQLNNDDVYVLHSERAFLLYSENIPGEICSSTGSKVGSVTASLEDPKQQFRIEKKGSNYYLYSVGAGKYVGANGAYQETASAVLGIDASGREGYPWKLSLNGNELNSQVANQMASGITVSNWDPADGGNSYSIELAIPEDKVYSISVLGTDSEVAGVVYNGEEYKTGATIETKKTLGKSQFQAIEVEGKMTVVSISGLVVYVSYFDEDTKFYTIQNG